MSDTESDPEFVNRAVFEYEKKGKRSRKEVLSEVGTSNKRRKLDVSRKAAASGGNEFSLPRGNFLYKYFAEVLPCYESEDESDDADMREDAEEYRSSASEDEDEEEKELQRNGRGVLLKPPEICRVAPVNQEMPQAEDSVTESESEQEALSGADRGCRRKQLEAQVQEDSVTESESDYEPQIVKSGARPRPATNNEIDSSETEYESEEDFDEVEGMAPKPNFVRNDSQNMLEPLILDGENNIRVPSLVNAFLREYQREGIRFFWERFRNKTGGVLGDDMGLGKMLLIFKQDTIIHCETNLGKTIQVISFLSAIMKKYGDVRDLNRRRKRVSRLQDSTEWKKKRKLPPADAEWPTCLIIAPSTVVHNWERELETWGYFEVGLYTGLPGDREPVLNDFKLGRLDILVTSFETARNDIALMDNLAFSVIFVDEAHKLKNPRSKITESFTQFRSEAVRFGLTGTAIQNSYGELWTILNWTSPGSLGTEKQWNEIVAKPLTAGQSASASDEERARGRIVAKILVENVLPLFFLRRTKDLIKNQLPEKFDEVVFCPLTPMQIHVYKRVLALKDVAELRKSSAQCECGSKKRRSKCCHPMESSHFFTYLSILLKVSNHLALIIPAQTDNDEQRKRNREIAQECFGTNRIPVYGQAIFLPEFCGKWNVLNTLLLEWRADPANKVLIFTKSVKLLYMLDHHLSTNGFPFVSLSGSTKQSERMPRIDQFNNEPDVFIFLISTLAGGTGLNLTSANKVVIFDPNWNPAHDLQAMDRAYRFGQTRDVHVYRLLGAGSVEELIYARQVYKQQMMKIGYEASNQTRYFHGVQDDKTRRGELFGLENIFKLHEDTLATKMAIEKAHLAEFDWALLHMDSKTAKKTGKTGKNLVVDLDVKDDADARGLATLLFDDSSVPVTGEERENEIQQILSGSIKYSHRNDSLLRPSHIEEVSLRTTLKKKRTAKKQAQKRTSTKKEQSVEPVAEWPPRRSHHLAPQSPKSKLRLRKNALVETGVISSFDDLPSFAVKFGDMSPSRQAEILSWVDQYEKEGKRN